MKNSIVHIIIVLLFFSSSIFSQNDTLSDKQLCDLFHQIDEKDQSNFKDPELRKQLIIENFDTIISIIKNQGFPKYQNEPKKKKDKYIITMSISLNFIHILQIAPEKMLNYDVINLLKKEINNERLDKDILRDALNVLHGFNLKGQLLLNEQNQKMLLIALDEWGINLNEKKQ